MDDQLLLKIIDRVSKAFTIPQLEEYLSLNSIYSLDNLKDPEFRINNGIGILKRDFIMFVVRDNERDYNKNRLVELLLRDGYFHGDLEKELLENGYLSNSNKAGKSNIQSPPNPFDNEKELKNEEFPPVQVFYSYAHEDEMLRIELEKHLSMLKRKNIIDTWNDRKIVPGSEIEKEIDNFIDTADIILFLVSSDFLASDYCNEIEVARAMERHNNNEARVIPIILRDCRWEEAPFRKLLALPTDGQPVKSWGNQDEAFRVIVDGIVNAIEQLNRKKENVEIGINNNENSIDEKTVEHTNFFPQWDRQELHDWTYPVPGYKVIPLSNSVVNKLISNEFTFPTRKPLLGKTSIPFELNLDEAGHIRGIEVFPRHPADETRSVEVFPGASSPQRVHVLLAATKGFRIKENVEFEGRKIGSLEFHKSKTSSGKFDLVLGGNIRDMSYRHPALVNKAVDQSVEQVWRPDGDAFTLDMFTGAFIPGTKEVNYFTVTSKVEGVPTSYKEFLPRILIMGLTYEIEQS